MARTRVRETLYTAAAMPALACSASYAAEQRYPSKPIRFIIPTAPGGGSDVVVRLLGQKFTNAWGQQANVKIE